MDLIQPQEIEVRGKKYIISKFPATEGREILFKYPPANVALLSNYTSTEEVLQKLLSYVEAVDEEGMKIRLTTKALVNNHVPDWEALALLEAEMISYNCSFFQHGNVTTFLTALRNLDVAKITEMLIPLLDKLSPAVKQHFMN